MGELVLPLDSCFDSLTHLAYGDVRADQVVTPRYLEIRAKATKTDLFWHGVSIPL